MGSKGTCKADGCEKDVRAKGYCDRHYRKWRKGVMGKPRHRTCNEKGCHKARDRRGYCAEHFGEKFGKKPQPAGETAAPPAAAEAPAAE
jgi:hypothetical protein